MKFCNIVVPENLRILFFKSDQFSLFDAPVQVRASVSKDGHVTRPYTRIQKVRGENNKEEKDDLFNQVQSKIEKKIDESTSASDDKRFKNNPKPKTQIETSANARTKTQHVDFRQWKEDADMPEFINGNWVDLETGIAYKPEQTVAVERNELSDEAKNGRSVSKNYGGKALTGSAKQKEWGEKIRASKLEGMLREHAEIVCDPKSVYKTAKFWIDNRFKSASEISKFAIECKSQLQKINILKNNKIDTSYGKEKNRIELERETRAYERLLRTFSVFDY